MAYLLPYFSSVIALIAAVGDVSSQITLPALFALALLVGHEESALGTTNRVSCSCFVSACAVYESVQSTACNHVSVYVCACVR